MLVSKNLGNKFVNQDNDDFVYNEVIIWLMQQMSSKDICFESYVFDSGNVRFNNSAGIYLSVEINKHSYNSNKTIKFLINKEVIFEYNITEGHFSNKESFKNVYINGSYIDFTIDGITIDGLYRPLGIRHYKDNKLKKLIWGRRVKSGDYLNTNITIKYFEVNKVPQTFREVNKLSATIISAFKKNFLYKNFIAGVNIEKLNFKCANIYCKESLTISSVAKYLEHTKCEHTIYSPDNSGPWATTGTNKFFDIFDVTKLVKTHPDAPKFLEDNIKEIFECLQKSKYSHSLGYYTYIACRYFKNHFEINASSTTYYN